MTLASSKFFPKPRRMLWQTLLKRPRSVRWLAPRISYEDVIGGMPEADQAAQWGEIILLEDIVVALHRDGTSSWLTHLITVPWSDESLAEWDEVARLYEPQRWKARVLKAVVHLPDEQKQFKARQTVSRVSPKENGLSLTFAPLRPGVVIEFEEQLDYYRVDDRGPTIWAQFLFQALCPCRHRRITVAIADPFEAELQHHFTEERPAVSRERGYQVYRWDFRDVEGIEGDIWTPPPRDFVPWVDLSSIPDWGAVEAYYQAEILPSNHVDDSVKEMAEKLTAEAKTDLEKVQAVFHYATRDVRYGRHPHEVETRAIRDPSKMLQDLRGDCKDKSALMISLLAEVNISAHVAVVVTSPNGLTLMLPSLRFDHAIVVAHVDGEDIWMDPAGGPNSFGSLPLNDQGVMGLILNDGDPKIITVPHHGPEGQHLERVCCGSLEANGDYQFEAKIVACGDRAAFYRATLIDRSEDQRLRLLQQSVSEERPGAEVSQIEFGPIEDLTCDLCYGYHVLLPEWARRIEDLLLLHVPWAEPVEFSGPISAAERLQPLQSPSALHLYERHEIRLPEGFSGYGLPIMREFTCDWATYSCEISCTDGVLNCERTMEFRGGIIAPEAFGKFRHFWEDCARSDSADVVLMRHRDETTDSPISRPAD